MLKLPVDTTATRAEWPLTLPLNDAVRTRRQLNPGVSSTGYRLVERLRLHPLWSVEAIDRLQIVARQHQRCDHAGRRTILPHNRNFAGLRQVAIQNEEGSLAVLRVQR